MKLSPLLLFSIILLIIPCAAVTVTPGVQFNLTNASVGFQENFSFDEITVQDDTLSLKSGTWSNLTVTPTDTIIINISKWNIGGDYRKSWTEFSGNQLARTAHTITGYPSGTITILKNTSPQGTTSINSGTCNFLYSSGYDLTPTTFDLIYSPPTFLENENLDTTKSLIITGIVLFSIIILFIVSKALTSESIDGETFSMIGKIATFCIMLLMVVSALFSCM